MGVKLPDHKTKIVCTIGPASHSETVLEELMGRGMNVARLNFAHGTVEGHREDIRRIRLVAAKLERSCMILADLPGPKIRVGKLQSEPIMLKKGDPVTLTTKDVPGTASRISVNYERLPESVTPGNVIFLNDGFIQLHVQEVSGTEVICEVVIGGPLLSHKGLNLPGVKLLVDPVTDSDLVFVEFCLQEGIDTFGVSFVEKADDIHKVRNFSRERGKSVHVVAKIERAEAVENIDEILDAADALMIARGDLGVQIPVEDVPAVQKKLIHKANLMGRPVITATQMLVSMTENIRPTRAEASDVANAILDGTDAVMLSEETAIGRYPVETVDMMARIASSIEREWKSLQTLSDLREYSRPRLGHQQTTPEDVISFNVVEAVRALDVRCVVTPTQNGSTPRRISRFRPDCWTLAFSRSEGIHRFLDLSYGVFPVLLGNDIEDSPGWIMKFIGESGLVIEDDTGISRKS
ncbi:MAG: pyruvate kinase [Desulfobacteraceae bacterium]|nr:pyruvate kinase [Desulfobacteraceae bacterium]